MDYMMKTVFPLGDLVVLQKMISALRFENRFTLDKSSEAFAHALLRLAESHKNVVLPMDKELFRARLKNSHGAVGFLLCDMGAPPPHLATHGRLNPRGIPYLYLASDSLTAVSECRPHTGAKLTVASFKPVKDLRLVSFSAKHMVNPIAETTLEGAEITWTQIVSSLFSTPFDPRDDTMYVPTQYLAERFKGAGWDGVMYDSALNKDGYNIALFDVDSAKALEIFDAEIHCIRVQASFGPRNR